MVKQNTKFKNKQTTALFFLFFLLSFLPLFDETCEKIAIMKNQVFSKKKKSHPCCNGVPGGMCCGKIYDCFSALVAFWIPESCVVSCCVPSFQFSAHPCRLQPMVLWPVRQPNDGRNESIPCVHVWSGLCIACPYLC